ncbi:MAG: TonB-dependent receptor plug domain-containing protein [Bacteroidaceae bacterium]|nr:TonB-dependent receptor plug domain-containing protein [Bacteroidaceae bacterium]
MKKVLMAALVCGVAQTGWAYDESEPDSIALNELSEVVVKAVKAQKYAPFAMSRIGKEEVQQFARSGQELPFLLSRTPGVTAWSENGLGTGTTYMRLRGSGDSRINVTLDGVSLNSPEDQCVFWANMNSYAALLGGMQVQRGVGTSTNGDGAFGGSVVLSTATPGLAPSAQVSASYGSYGTYNAGGKFSSGLMGNHWMLDGAYHHTGTDGYVHGTGGQSGSYYGGLTYVNNDGTLKLSYKNIGNYEKTGQAWNGVTAGNDDYSMNAYDGVRTYADMYRLGLGKYNSLYERFEPDWNGGWTTERYRLADGTLWDKTTDNFRQNHNLLNLAWRINDFWSTSATLHYTHGHGYYDEFRYQNKLKKFGLSNFVLLDGSVLKKTDFVRQKGLTQDTYGMVWNVNYQDRRWDVMAGASFRNFEGNHWGYLTYVANEELRHEVLADGKYKYYDSDATKADNQLFLKGTYHLTSEWDVFADVQYRHVGFMTNGINDKFYEEGNAYYNQSLNIKKQYDFINPKAGLSYHNGGHNAYLSYALSHREPERNNFTDNGAYPAPKAESLHDVEAGYGFNSGRWHAAASLYAMLYHNQFVQTGAVSDIGESLTTNIARSHRLGVELSAGVKVAQWLDLEANAALSRNRIKDFTEVVETYDGDWNDMAPTEVHYDNSTLTFSPSAIVNGFADFHFKGFKATWHTNLVSRQYLDNTACKERSLPKYSQTNVYLSYDLKCGRKGLKSTVLGVNFNNIFNRHYAAGGWVYSAIVGDDYPQDSRYYQIGYIPMAGFTVMGHVTLKF